jgi:hypothetical protein
VTKPMTVAELRAALADMPDAAHVITEGCDCYGDVGEVELAAPDGSHPAGVVELSRATEETDE